MTRPKYQDYIKSPEWERVRKRILKRARGKCEKCRKRPPIQVHHLTYARLGNERDEDLLAVCGPCHQAFHPEKQFLQPCFVGEYVCALCPSETADIYVGDRALMFVCNGCGDATARPRKAKAREKPRKAGKKPPARPQRPKKPPKAAGPWEAEREREKRRERSMIGEGRKKLAAKGLKGFT